MATPKIFSYELGEGLDIRSPDGNMK